MTIKERIKKWQENQQRLGAARAKFQHQLKVAEAKAYRKEALKWAAISGKMKARGQGRGQGGGLLAQINEFRAQAGKIGNELGSKDLLGLHEAQKSFGGGTSVGNALGFEETRKKKRDED